MSARFFHVVLGERMGGKSQNIKYNMSARFFHVVLGESEELGLPLFVYECYTFSCGTRSSAVRR